VLLLLAGCSAMLDPGPPPLRLGITPAMPARVEGHPLNRQLTVAEPVAGQELNSDNIVLIFRSREIRYLAGARWTSAVPFLVQRHLVEALEKANILRGVSSEIAGAAADARLLTDIKRFGLEYDSEHAVPTAVFDATFRLLRLSDGKIMGTRNVAVRTPATGKDNASLARAVEEAFAGALRETTFWVAERMRTAH
jgi:cholesterol transport system auxiliary component